MHQNSSVQSVLNDQDRMEDLLTQEKFLINAYGTYLPEATCPQLREVLKSNLNECAENQYAVFDKMSQMGWYPAKNAPEPEIAAARQKFQQLQSQL